MAQTIEDIKKTTSVQPLKHGGASFKTHKLKSSGNSIKYVATIGGVLFCLLFLIIGLIVLFIAIKPAFINQSFKNINWFLILFGLIFSFAGGSILVDKLKPRVFNKTKNIYYKSFSSSSSTPLNKIIAIQILGETVRGKDSTYGSFELNLVLSDASRLNVVDHGNLKSVINDAYILSKFLNVPIWHAESRNN